MLKCTYNSYYLPDSEVDKLESETSDTQKEIIDLRVELRVEKEKTNSLEAYSRSLELKIKELEQTIENNVTEVSEFFNDGVEIFECNSCNMLIEENEPYNNFCPNCGRKIVR